jgi:aminoglycoside phosphotransferase (APT) family kinase protein
VSVIDDLARIDLGAADAAALALAPGPLVLRRAWARSATHALLEHAGAGGALTAGQWMDDADALRQVAAETADRAPGRPVRVVAAPGGRSVLLQPGGADRRLVGLLGVLATPGAKLLAHRPERRAVVRLAGAEGVRYAKVVPPGRIAPLAAAARHAGAATDRLRTAPLVAVDEARGVAVFAALPGRTLAEIDDAEELARGARAAGEALRALHALAPPRGARTHDVEAELRLLEEQVTRAAALVPDLAHRIGAAPARVRAALRAGRGAAAALIHRDFYDQQVILGADGRAGVLDLDTMAIGEPALDVANMLVHFDLRAMQAPGPAAATRAVRAAAAFLDAYAPDAEVERRIAAWADATRLRLAAMYVLRPRWAHLAGALAASIRGGSTGAGAPPHRRPSARGPT